MALSKPTNGSNADYANRIGLLFDAFNNGNYAFPATQVPSADANTLDDYEEGTWTPSVGGTATYNSRSGSYTKVGRLVAIALEMSILLIGTGSVSAISGGPFTAGVTTGLSVGYWVGSAANYAAMHAYIGSGSGTITLQSVAAAGASGVSTPTFFANSAAIAIGGIFRV